MLSQINGSRNIAIFLLYRKFSETETFYDIRRISVLFTQKIRLSGQLNIPRIEPFIHPAVITLSSRPRLIILSPYNFLPLDYSITLKMSI